MRKKEKLKKKISNYFFDHRYQYYVVHELYALIFCTLSGIIFAFGFACFTSVYTEESLRIVTGGVSGLCQNVVLILEICGVQNVNMSTVYSVLYFAINVPILLFAFFKISKRFAIYSGIAVGMSSLFVSIFSSTIAQNIATNPVLLNSAITRVIIAGSCSGLSAALAFKCDFSCGGIDVITYYFSMKKSTNVGKYSFFINGIVLTLYCGLLIVKDNNAMTNTLLTLIHSIIYQFICSLVIDAIHVKNKKDKIEIITTNENLVDILLSLFPHSATLYDATGAFSNNKKICINMVVSSNEVRKVVAVCQKADENSFISVVPLYQVYGNFFTRPVQ